jgi:hypothetical protein
MNAFRTQQAKVLSLHDLGPFQQSIVKQMLSSATSFNNRTFSFCKMLKQISLDEPAVNPLLLGSVGSINVRHNNVKFQLGTLHCPHLCSSPT